MNAPSAYTKMALFAFLKKAESTGLYKANTAGGMRAAAGRLLEDVQDNEDVRDIDVKEAALRYHNKHPSELSSGSLAEYQRRLRRLLDQFASFNENPAGYRPKGRITRSLTARGDEGNAITRPKRTRTTKGAVSGKATSVLRKDDETVPVVSTPGVPMLRLSYPIRDDVLAEIAVPRAMTTEEARRLCAFVMTLAKDFAPT